MRATFTAMILASCVAGVLSAQWKDDIHPFVGAAVMLGAQGFARPPVTTAVAGGYAYAPIGSLLLGGQVGSSFGDGDRSRAAYALATIGYAQARAHGWQFYPFAGLGVATLRARRGSNDAGLAGGAGFGADALVGGGRAGMLLGARIGYLTRSLNDDESIAYATMTLGWAGRFHSDGAPPAVAAHRRPSR